MLFVVTNMRGSGVFGSVISVIIFLAVLLVSKEEQIDQLQGHIRLLEESHGHMERINHRDNNLLGGLYRAAKGVCSGDAGAVVVSED
jgi:hypothetical protein